MAKSLADYLRGELADAMAQVQEEQAKLGSLHEELQESTVSVQAKNRTLEVILADKGELREIKFNGMSYRSMAPAELSAVLVETINSARAEYAKKINEALAPIRGLSSQMVESVIGGGELHGVLKEFQQMFDGVGSTEEASEEDD